MTSLIIQLSLAYKHPIEFKEKNSWVTRIGLRVIHSSGRD